MADSEVRQKFEAWAKTEYYGNGFGPPRDADGYKDDEVDNAWKGWQAGMRAGEIARSERSDKDYAIEHAEYLAKAAEFYLDTRNLADAAADDEELFDPQRLYDANNALRSAIYEFRKRAKRVLPAAPEEKKP